LAHQIQLLRSLGLHATGHTKLQHPDCRTARSESYRHCRSSHCPIERPKRRYRALEPCSLAVQSRLAHNYMLRRLLQKSWALGSSLLQHLQPAWPIQFGLHHTHPEAWLAQRIGTSQSCALPSSMSDRQLFRLHLHRRCSSCCRKSCLTSTPPTLAILGTAHSSQRTLPTKRT
jgi:hypothetical protein